jgi:hypothetical protein
MAAASTPQFTLPLPDGWSPLEVVSDTIVADGLELGRAGIASRAPTGEEITGSAADLGPAPIARAGYELLERVATLEAMSGDGALRTRTLGGEATGIIAPHDAFRSGDAPDRWRFARSNGIALHVDWQTAARSALEELVERDRILRCWYGEISPTPLAVDWATTALASAQNYEWIAIELGASADWMTDVRVVSVFGFPRAPDAPFVFGHGARSTTSSALDKAMREAMQILGFLWGEPLPAKVPTLAPTPAYHLDYWQLPMHRDALRRWLDGGHARYRQRVASPERPSNEVTFVDLGSPWLRAHGFHLAKAQNPHAMPLAFGDAPFGAHLPSELRFHPIA